MQLHVFPDSSWRPGEAAPLCLIGEQYAFSVLVLSSLIGIYQSRDRSNCWGPVSQMLLLLCQGQVLLGPHNSPWKQCDASFFTVRLKRSTRGKPKNTILCRSGLKMIKPACFSSVADESSSGIFVRYLSTCSALHWNRRRQLQLKDKYSAFQSVKVPGTHYLQTQIWS